MRMLLILLLISNSCCYSQLDTIQNQKEGSNFKWVLNANINYWIYFPGLDYIGLEGNIERRIVNKPKFEINMGLGYYYSFYLSSVPLYVRAQYHAGKGFSPFLKLSYPLLQNRSFVGENIAITNILFNSSIGLNYNVKRSIFSVGIGGWFIERTDFQYPYDAGPESLGFLPVVEIGYGWRF